MIFFQLICTLALSFLAVCVCQYFLLNSPNEYWMFYTIVTPLLMVYRIIYFRSQDMQYFLLDFCYFSLLLSLANLHLLPASATLFKVCFIFSNGPVMLAIIVWRCSFVFHDYDKQTSVYIHFLPGMLYYTWRWHHPLQSAAAPELCAVDYAIAVGFYLVWQVGYYICTETHWGSRAALDANPKLLTSLRWLAQDHKNATAVGVLRLCRAIGVFAPTEKYDARTVKTKVVFCAAQLAFTVVCFAPTPLLYYSQRAHLAYLILVFTTSLYSGASFYIEIFRYTVGH